MPSIRIEVTGDQAEEIKESADLAGKTVEEFIKHAIGLAIWRFPPECGHCGQELTETGVCTHCGYKHDKSSPLDD